MGGSLAPPVGFEPTTTRLTAEGSATELRRIICLYLFWIFPFSIYEKCWHLPIFPDRLQSSIFGTIELNFRVRYGNGWTLNVINTNFSSSLFLSYHIYSFLSILFLHLFSLVTRTGIEPVFPAWEAGVFTAWPTSLPSSSFSRLFLWCTIRDSNPGHPD